ncbi:MAG: class I SAM-dependent methyltransferase, partial [Acidimicrobiia bacterium]
MPVHRIAAAGFGSVADLYESARPGYPDDAVTWLTKQLRVGPDSLVVDLAAGTGKLTRLLLDSGATVVAVEPIEVMRALITPTSPGSLPVGGEAEALPLRSRSVDAVTIAQGFHWFDTPATHAELARVIRPGGGLGLVWNARDRTVAWVNEIWSIMDRVEKN